MNSRNKITSNVTLFPDTLGMPEMIPSVSERVSPANKSL